jgi:hypothetical protein
MPRDGSGPTEEIEKPEAGTVARTDAEGLANSLSPVDLPEPPVPQPHGLRWTTTVIVSASLMLLLLNAHAIRDWSYQLPPSAASARVVSAAESWFDAVDQVGLNRPVEIMHGWWQGARDARFQRDDAGLRDDAEVGPAAPESPSSRGARQS